MCNLTILGCSDQQRELLVDLVARNMTKTYAQHGYTSEEYSDARALFYRVWEARNVAISHVATREDCN